MAIEMILIGIVIGIVIGIAVLWKNWWWCILVSLPNFGRRKVLASSIRESGLAMKVQTTKASSDPSHPKCRAGGNISTA